MKTLATFTLSVALFLPGSIAWSQSAAEQDFFGGDNPTVEKAKPSTADSTLAFTADSFKVGGVLDDKFEWNGGWTGSSLDPAALAPDWQDSVGYQLNNIFYLDSRPNKDYRVRVSLATNAPFTNSVTSLSSAASTKTQTNLVPTVRVWELFADVTVWDQIFVRFGKQEASWGVAYYYSAGDPLSSTGINATDPGAQREGPVALKVSVPFPNQQANLFLYTVAPDSAFGATTTATYRDLGYAAQSDITLAGTQFSLGGYFQKDQAEKLVGTASAGLGWLNLPFVKDINWFAEIIGQYGSNVWTGTGSQSLVNQGGMVTFASMTRPLEPSLSTVSGLSYSDSDLNLSLRIEYYYNGLGATAQDYQQRLANAYRQQVAGSAVFPNATLTTNDFAYTGIHNLTESLTFTTLANTKFDLAFLSQQNLSDASGWIQPKLTYNFNDYLSAYIGLDLVWGADGSEFPVQFLTQGSTAPQTQRVTMILGVTVGSTRY